MLITTLVVSFCKDGGGSVNPLNAELNPICRLLALLGAHLIFHVSGLRINVKLWFLVVYVRCEFLCRLVLAGNVFMLILIVVILYAW